MKTSITLDATGLSAPELDGLVINPDSITWIQPANPEVAKFLATMKRFAPGEGW